MVRGWEYLLFYTCTAAGRPPITTPKPRANFPEENAYETNHKFHVVAVRARPGRSSAGACGGVAKRYRRHVQWDRQLALRQQPDRYNSSGGAPSNVQLRHVYSGPIQD